MLKRKRDARGGASIRSGREKTGAYSASTVAVITVGIRTYMHKQEIVFKGHRVKGEIKDGFVWTLKGSARIFGSLREAKKERRKQLESAGVHFVKVKR